MIHPLAFLMEGALDLHTRSSSIFALKQDVAIRDITVAHLHHLLQLTTRHCLRRLYLTLTPANVLPLMLLHFGNVSKLLEK